MRTSPGSKMADNPSMRCFHQSMRQSARAPMVVIAQALGSRALISILINHPNHLFMKSRAAAAAVLIRAVSPPPPKLLQ
jgi:hypothetical protein